MLINIFFGVFTSVRNSTQFYFNRELSSKLADSSGRIYLLRQGVTDDFHTSLIKV